MWLRQRQLQPASCLNSFLKMNQNYLFVGIVDSGLTKMCRVYATVMMLIWVIAVASAEVGPNGNINLANYGVFTKKIGEARLVTNFWTNAFILPLPAPEFTQIRTPSILCIGNRTGRSVDLLLNLSTYANRNEPCGDHADFSKFIHQLYISNRDVRVQTIKNIYALFPNQASTRAGSRNKKALLSIVGKISSYLFGTISEKQLQEVSRHVSNALHEGSLGINEIQHQIDSLTSLSKLTNERIEISNRRTQEITEQLYGFAVKMKSNNDSVMRYTLLALKKLYLATDMMGPLQSLLQDLENIANGKLEPGVISLTQLNAAIKRINQILRTTLPKFQLVMTNPHHYYSRAKVATIRINQSLVIEVQFPLTSWDHYFDIYKMIVTKVPLPDRDHCTRLDGLPRFIAMEKYRTNYIVFENEPMIVDNMIESGERPILNSKNTCVGALLKMTLNKFTNYVNQHFLKSQLNEALFV